MSAIDDLIAQAAQSSDQSKDTTTTFERQLPAAGRTPLRFIEYIELGMQKQKAFQGKAKPDALDVMLTFECLGPKYIRDIEVEGGTKTICDVITQRQTVKLNEKAQFRKLFNKMAYGRDKKHLAQMLGEDFIGTITHSDATDKDGKAIKQYANLRTADGEIGISSPFIDKMDEETGESTKVRLKAGRTDLHPIKIFLFDHPTKETWDSLFIDGYNEVKQADGTVVKQSKNWIQERILGATNFKGSALEAMLHDLGGLSIDPELQPAEAPEAEAEPEVIDLPPQKAAVTPPAAAKQSAKAAPPPAKATNVAGADAALEALGLTG